MKLKLVERSNNTRTSFPKVSINPLGNFYVNRAAMELLKIEGSVKLQFFQDEADPQKWFIHLTDEGYISLTPKNKNLKKDSSGSFFLTDIAHKITTSFLHEKGILKFKLLDAIKVEGLEFYPLEVIKTSINIELPKNDKPYEFSKAVK